MTPLMLGIAALTVIVALAAFHWAKSRTLDLQHGRADLQHFTTAALTLIDDPNLPETVVAFVLRLSNDAGRPFLALWFTHEVLTGKISLPARPPRQ